MIVRFEKDLCQMGYSCLQWFCKISTYFVLVELTQCKIKHTVQRENVEEFKGYGSCNYIFTSDYPALLLMFCHFKRCVTVKESINCSFFM